jgi:CMP/dCMP kinase
MGAITISREMGSQGCQVARAVAQRLGFQVVWREAINRAAMRAGAPEVALAVIDELGLLGLHPDPGAVRAYLEAISQVLGELADTGRFVIVGRAGQVILRGREDVLHVRVMAPVDTRIARLVGAKGITPEAARAQVEASDHHRRQYLHRYYQIAWDDPELYDLVINTAHLAPAVAGELIGRAYEQKSNQEILQPIPASAEFDCD